MTIRVSASLAAILALALSSAAQADVSISNMPTQNMTCNAGVCTPTAPKAVLNVYDVTNFLANGDLTVQTGNGDRTAAGIDILNSFSWTGASRLTLTAKHNIVVKAPITVAGNGALTITYGVGNPKSDLLFEKKGKINFWDVSSSVIINGGGYRLVADIKSLQLLVRNTKHGHYGSYAMPQTMTLRSMALIRNMRFAVSMVTWRDLGTRSVIWRFTVPGLLGIHRVQFATSIS